MSKPVKRNSTIPEGDANNYSTYDGTGGIPMGSLCRRLLHRLSTVGDIAKVPFSDDITAKVSF